MLPQTSDAHAELSNSGHSLFTIYVFPTLTILVVFSTKKARFPTFHFCGKYCHLVLFLFWGGSLKLLWSWTHFCSTSKRLVHLFPSPDISVISAQFVDKLLSSFPDSWKLLKQPVWQFFYFIFILWVFQIVMDGFSCLGISFILSMMILISVLSSTGFSSVPRAVATFFHFHLLLVISRMMSNTIMVLHHNLIMPMLRPLRLLRRCDGFWVMEIS